MNIRKQVLTEMHRCYACTPMTTHGEQGVFFATEGEGPCLRFCGPDFSRQETVWAGPGGTMSMIPLPGTDGEFLAVQKFFRMFQWEEAKLVRVCPPAAQGEDWTVHDLFTLPYLHRFDVLRGADGTTHFVGATLAGSKESKEDWSSPGSLYHLPLPADTADLRGPLVPQLLHTGLAQNHGYCRARLHGKECGFFTAREGVFAVTPPAVSGGDWQIEQILDVPVSDIALVDIDGDGEQELATIEAFHGSHFRVWKQDHGQYRPVYEHPDNSDFYHVVWGGMLCGEPAFIGGCRRGTQSLFVLRCTGTDPLTFSAMELDNGVGPSNVAVLSDENHPESSILLSANREQAQAVLYHLTR